MCAGKQSGGVCREGEAAVNRKGRILEGKGIFTLVEGKSWSWFGRASTASCVDVAQCSHPRGFTLIKE